MAVPVPLDGPFTYRVPDGLLSAAQPGVRVMVPFGPRKLVGIVLAVRDDASGAEPPNLKSIERVLDVLPPLSEELLRLGCWVADYYLAPPGEVLRAMLPIGAEIEARRAVRLTEAGGNFVSPVAEALQHGPVGEEALRKKFGLAEADLRALERQGLIERYVETRERRTRSEMLVVPAEGALGDRAGAREVGAGEVSDGEVGAGEVGADGTPAAPGRTGRPRSNRAEPETATDAQAEASRPAAAHSPELTKRQHRVVQTLVSSGVPMAASELATKANVPASVIRDMLAAGLLNAVSLDTPAGPVEIQSSRHMLNPQQQAALAALTRMIAAKEFSAALLQGVTGSGKTEVYMHAIAEVVQGGGSALMLVPEIALTPAMADQFQQRFGDAVAILHSAFPGRQRTREWKRARTGEAPVVIGTRSAIFAPLDRPALIIVDEEHDPSYKQEETPRYNARDVAVVRARNAGGVVVLGSATPSIESRYNAAAGKYRLLELADRVEGRPLADVRIVDMRGEFRERKKVTVFSRTLSDAIQARLEAGEQVILLLNRRGYSSVVTCRACGQSVQCVNCSISLTYHRREDRLMCHYCDYSIPRPMACPQCGNDHIYFLGEGSEKIESLVANQFAEARVVRLDRDSARGKMQYEQILGDFRAGKYDILVGTQMIAKGHDIHRVTLVGVISADIALGFPDFRAAERTFQLLTQVAGRAGRGDLPGAVVIQTYFPDHYAIRAASAQDYNGFYEKELRFRRTMYYPPFGALANILIRSTRLELAVKWSGALGRHLAESKAEGVRVLGPAAAPLAKLKQEFRYQFLIKSERRDTLHRLLKSCRGFAREQNLAATAMIIDVDPFSLM